VTTYDVCGHCRGLIVQLARDSWTHCPDPRYAPRTTWFTCEGGRSTAVPITVLLTENAEKLDALVSELADAIENRPGARRAFDKTIDALAVKLYPVRAEIYELAGI